MREATDAIRKLLFDSEQVPAGPLQVALIEEAVRLADLHGELLWSYAARFELLGALLSARAEARASHGWIMDVYILQRS